MGQTVRVFHVDAFTSERFSGNPAGVVLDAEALSERDMLALARELNVADTAFVLPPDGTDHDLRVRFFTPRREAAFVGHATLALHAVLSELKLPARRRQKQAGGIVEVDTLDGAWPPRIAIHQPPPPPVRELATPTLHAVLEALGVRRDELDPDCSAVMTGTSSARLLIGLAHGVTLQRLQPDLGLLATLSERIGAPGYFLYSRRPSVADVYTEARMFCPALGFPEDAVSGNAHALLASYLLQQGLLDSQRDPDASGAIEFSGAQGHHMGRPGRVTVSLNLEQGELESVSIIGEAVIVFATNLEF